MARLPTSIRVLKNDTEGLNIQNTFNQAIYDAVMGQLTFTENVKCQIKEITFPTLLDYTAPNWSDISFPCTLRTKPIGVILLQIFKTNVNEAIYDPTSIDWLFVNGNVVIRYISGLENETVYTFRVLVI